MGFLHCGNVGRLDATKEQGPPPKWCRRQRVPELKYQVLQIGPAGGRRPQDGRKTEGDRSGKALHICRGHFVHYIDDGVCKGLFGAVSTAPSSWIAAHARGSLEHGKIVSTYDVRSPSVAVPA